jgi:hypothetical protein
MLRINVNDAKGGTVRLAPFGTEDGPEPCLVWVEPNRNSLVGDCKVQTATGELVTAKSERGLRAAAARIGCVVDPSLYLP